MKKFLAFLQSNRAVLLAAITSLATQLWHSVNAFVKLEVDGHPDYWNYVFGVLFAVSTSFAILLFTVRGRARLAYFFLAVEVFINVIHYDLMNLPLGPIMASTAFMCFIVPVTIAVYSREINTEETTLIEDKTFGPTVHSQRDPKIEPYTMSLSHNDSYDPFGPDDHHVIGDEEFIKEVNALAGFDVTKNSQSADAIDEDKRKQLRELWQKRKEMGADQVRSKIKAIVKGSNNPLFRNL